MQNKNNWFYQTLFSYLPIFFLIVSVLFLIFFLAFSEHIKTTTIKANEVFSEQIGQALDSYLVPVDQLIIKEFLMDELMRTFFSGQKSTPYTIYEISQKINNLIMSFPIIDSVYIVQKAEDLVISNTLFTSSQQFADREFITSQFEVATPTYWSGKRVYKDQKKYFPSNIISFARKVSLSSPNEGLIVVNIHADALRKLVVKMSSLETNFVNLYDNNGLLILATDESSSKESKPAPTELVKIKSNFTGWEIRSGIKNEQMFNFFASFPYFWVSLGVISILLGIVLIIFVTRKHYKPIESIINRINEMIASRNNGLFGNGQRDEMRFIEMAIDDLFKNANKYQTQYEQNIVNIRRNLFNELLDGVRVLNRENFESELEKLEIHADFDEIAVCILDMDKYNDFCERYSDKDQYLLKFLIDSVLNEISQSFGQHVWSEWISGSQLGIICLFNGGKGNSGPNDADVISAIADKLITWAKMNLGFTFTLSASESSSKTINIAQLYTDAVEALKYKAILGSCRFIRYQDLSSHSRIDIYNQIQSIHAMVHHYRVGKIDWKPLWAQLFYDIRTSWLPREEILSLLNYLIFYINRHMMELSPQIQDYWQREVIGELTDMADGFETLEEFQMNALELLQQTEIRLEQFRENRPTHDAIHEVKKYIEVNYANPDLSLVHLSQAFNLSKGYLSRLFKEEFGENFAEYLLRYRIERAKELLHCSKESVQEIGTRVGYLHSFSFIRVFKKNVGVTPGDFRK